MDALQQKLLKEIEEKDRIIAELTEKVKENSAYRKQIEGRINRTAKDAVFLDLFSNRTQNGGGESYVGDV